MTAVAFPGRRATRSPKASSSRRLVARRLGQVVPILLGVSLVVFLLIHLVPGDPARTLLGPQARPEAVEALREKLGLDESLPTQYVDHLGGLVTGDLGDSLTYDRPITSLIAGAWAPTLWLVVYAAVLIVAMALLLAPLAARKPGGFADGAVRGVSLVGLGMPSFWVGLLLILLLGTKLSLFPVSGYGEGFFGHLHSMFLPALTVALSMAPLTVRALRTALVEVYESEHLLAVRSKGLPERRVMRAYALRLGIVPMVSVLGVNLGWLVGNTVVIEQVFVIPGLGSMMVDSITNRDFPVVQALAMIFAVAVVLISLATDLARAALDPRVQLA